MLIDLGSVSSYCQLMADIFVSSEASSGNKVFDTKANSPHFDRRSVQWPPAGTVSKPVYRKPGESEYKVFLGCRHIVCESDFWREAYPFLGFDHDVSSDDLIGLIHDSKRTAEERFLACSFLSRMDPVLAGTGYYYLITCEEIGAEYKRIAFEYLLSFVRHEAKDEDSKKVLDFLNFEDIIHHIECILKIDTLSILDRCFFNFLLSFSCMEQVYDSVVGKKFEAFNAKEDIGGIYGACITMKVLTEANQAGRDLEEAGMYNFAKITFDHESTPDIFKMLMASLLCYQKDAEPRYFSYLETSLGSTLLATLFLLTAGKSSSGVCNVSEGSVGAQYLHRLLAKFGTLSEMDQDILVLFLEGFVKEDAFFTGYPEIQSALQALHAKKENWDKASREYKKKYRSYEFEPGLSGGIEPMAVSIVRDSSEKFFLREMTASFLQYLSGVDGRGYSKYGASGYYWLLQDEEWVGDKRRYALLRVLIADQMEPGKRLWALRELKAEVN